MKTDGSRAYTSRQFNLAVNLSATLGWAVFASPVLFAGRLDLLPWAALIGLPIALSACWFVAAPMLWRLMARPVSLKAVAIWGLGIPAAMALAGTVLMRLLGLRSYFDPHSSYQIGGGDYVQEADGILTPYGWWLTLQGCVQFVLVGLVIAMIVRAVVDPGTKPGPTALPREVEATPEN